jgi:dTDP-4-amino-4,6-dideoxygalactose transaminase
MAELAINGGPKVRRRLFPPYRLFGAEEQRAARRVLRSGVLSKFLGTWHPNFYGGPEVRQFEKEWATRFGVKHAVAVNSATSGLYCAVGASGAGPGDEVIVSPYTMSASAVAALVYNAIPIFADIEPEFFCLDPRSVEEKITPRTRAIVVVDLLGLPYDAKAINAIARKHKLLVIEDCAQSPGARYHGRWAGTLGDIGVFSLNYHKHIHTGEGGVVVTDDDALAEKVRLIRNHAEAVLAAQGKDRPADLINMIGFNYRMTEIEAAIGREQLRKLPGLLRRRRDNVAYLAERLVRIPCLKPARVRPGCEHSFYVHALLFDPKAAGVHRDAFVAAVKAELAPSRLREDEGVNIGCGYVKPLYLQPLYQRRIAYGAGGCPWTCAKSRVSYAKGLCPVTERLYSETLIAHELMRPGMTHRDLDDVVAAFAKVYEHRGEIVR